MKMTLQMHLSEGAARLLQAGVPDAELDAKYLLFDAFQTDMVHFLLDRNRPLPETEKVAAQSARYHSSLSRREQRIPLQQILETQDFYGRTFFVNEHVLIPRQDTETLVELVEKEHPGNGEAILDMCTGSGCIAISLAAHGGYGPVTAVDLSEEALKAAERNADALLGEALRKQFFLRQGDLFAALEEQAQEGPCSRKACGGKNADDAASRHTALEHTALEHTALEHTALEHTALEHTALKHSANVCDSGCGPYDILVSNPPYIPSQVIEGLEPEVRDHEPRMALDGSEDGLLFYRRLAKESGRFLKPGAAVYFEIGYDQGAAVSDLLLANGFSGVRVEKDAAGNDRIVTGAWTGRDTKPE